MIQRRMMSRHLLETALQIIRHQLHIIQIPGGLLHICLQCKVNISADCCRYKHAFSVRIQCLPKLRQKQRIILFIRSVRRNSCQRCARILPVNVNTVQTILLHNCECTRSKPLSSLFCSCSLGKAVCSPAAYGQYNLQLRIAFPNGYHSIPCILCIPYNFSVPDQTKCNIDHGKCPHILFSHII